MPSTGVNKSPFDGLEELRVGEELLLFGFQEEAESTEVVSLGFETELPDPDVHIRARASVLLIGLLVGLRFSPDGRDTEPGFAILEVPPCPGPRAWTVGDVLEENLGPEVIPTFDRLVLPEILALAEWRVGEGESDLEVGPVLEAIERASPAGSRLTWHEVVSFSIEAQDEPVLRVEGRQFGTLPGSGRPRRPPRFSGPVNVETELPDEPGEGDPRVALNRHFRPGPGLGESVDVNAPHLGDRLASLDAPVPGLRREREDPELMRTEPVGRRDRFPP
jgi:hypothetical protein